MSSQQTPESTPRRHPRKKRRRVSVVGYLLILFVVAFVLLLWAYFQQQRINSEATDALKDSASAVQSIQALIENNEELTQEVKDLTDQLDRTKDDLTDTKERLTTTADQLEETQKALIAMDWLREIEILYNIQYYRACRSMITEFENSGLPDYLPHASLHSYNGEQNTTPAQTYADIKDALY